MSAAVRLDCYSLIAEARLIAPPAPSRRVAILTPGMADVLAKNSVDLTMPERCRSLLARSYSAADVEACLTEAIASAWVIRARAL